MEPSVSPSVHLVPPQDLRTTVLVKVLDAPGPSGYQSLRYTEEKTVEGLPEIDSVALQSRDVLFDFLKNLMGKNGESVQVTCLQPRLPTLRKLLDAKPGESTIEVPLGGADGGRGA